MSDMKETDAMIITRDIAVRSECPYCGHVNESPICDFSETALWYGEEMEWCVECFEDYRITYVERDIQ